MPKANLRDSPPEPRFSSEIWEEKLDFPLPSVEPARTAISETASNLVDVTWDAGETPWTRLGFDSRLLAPGLSAVSPHRGFQKFQKFDVTCQQPQPMAETSPNVTSNFWNEEEKQLTIPEQVSGYQNLDGLTVKARCYPPVNAAVAKVSCNSIKWVPNKFKEETTAQDVFRGCPKEHPEGKSLYSSDSINKAAAQNSWLGSHWTHMGRFLSPTKGLEIIHCIS